MYPPGCTYQQNPNVHKTEPSGLSIHRLDPGLQVIHTMRSPNRPTSFASNIIWGRAQQILPA